MGENAASFLPCPYYLSSAVDEIVALFKCDSLPDEIPTVVKPRRRGLVIRAIEQRVEPALCQWGFLARWTRDNSDYVYNARIESLLTNEHWRSWFEERRCLVPASSWALDHDGKGFAAHATDALFAFAGIHTLHERLDGPPVPVFAIVTGPSTDTAYGRFCARAPVVVPPDMHDQWLFDEDASRVHEDICKSNGESEYILT